MAVCKVISLARQASAFADTPAGKAIMPEITDLVGALRAAYEGGCTRAEAAALADRVAGFGEAAATVIRSWGK